MTNEAEGMDRSPLQWLEWLAENSGDMTIASMAMNAEVVVSQVAEMGAAALRAQAERVRVLEEENADTIVRWCARMAEIREASGVGVKPMLGEVPGAIAERIAAAEARAEAAERRAGELEGAMVYMRGLRLGCAGMSFNEANDHFNELAARALLPATQAEDAS